MRFFSVFTSLRIKLLAVIVLTVCLFSSVVGIYAVKKAREIIEKQSDNYGASIVAGITAALAEPLNEGRFMDIKKGIEAIGKSYSTIQSIDLVVKKKRFARYEKNEKLEGTLRQYEGELKVGEIDSFGIVRVNYVLGHYFNTFIAELEPVFNMVIVALGFVTVFLFVVINALLIVPIRRLEKGTEIIGSGNLAHVIHMKRSDELGTLANSFNVMTLNLKSARDEIEEWNRTLEQKVKERTEELRLAHEKIQEMQYELMESGKMATIGMIGAGVAHELNNPLTCILGYSQLMLQKIKQVALDTGVQEKYEKFLSTIEKESKRCRSIVDSLLNFARRGEGEFKPVSISEVIENTIAVMSFQARKWNVDIKVEKENQDDNYMIEGNGDKLQQIFINFLSNAHVAMPEGGSFTFSLKNVQCKGIDCIEIACTDTGCGIPADKIGKLFEAFFSSKKTDKNLGLGLSISNQIVLDHKGLIRVESEVGVGTSFIVTLSKTQEKGLVEE